MTLTKKDKLTIQRLLSAGQILSNLAFHLGQGDRTEAQSCRDAWHRWDHAYADAKSAIRKLKLPPF